MPTIAKLDSVDSLEAAFAESHDHPVLLFKHSLTCSISRRAFDVYQRFVGDQPDDAGTSFGLIEIQRQRDLSRRVADRTGVQHESPQALLLKDGRVVWHDSHWHITTEALEKALAG